MWYGTFCNLLYIPVHWGSGGAYAGENMSGRAHSVLCEIPDHFNFRHVIPPMFDPAHYWGPYLRL